MGTYEEHMGLIAVDTKKGGNSSSSYWYMPVCMSEKKEVPTTSNIFTNCPVLIWTNLVSSLKAPIGRNENGGRLFCNITMGHNWP